MNVEIKIEKIEKLLHYLNQAKNFHEEYFNSGKIFKYTICLRKINEKILILIREINFENNKELKISSLDLVKHLDEWISIWDKEKNIRKPNDDDEFIFTGYKTYPQNFDALFIKYSQKFKEI